MRNQMGFSASSQDRPRARVEGLRTMGGLGTLLLAAGAQVLQREARVGWLLFCASKQVRRKVEPIPTDVWTTRWQPVPPVLRLVSGYGVLC